MPDSRGAAAGSSRVAPSQTLDDRLTAITGLDTAGLRAAWEDQFGRPPPMSLSRRLLELAAAYHVHAKLYGGLKRAVRRWLLQAGTPAGAADRPPRKKRSGPLAPGTRLVREWQGRPHTVEVAESGFLYAGRRYRSLSAIARTITGARWSGPRFFGL